MRLLIKVYERREANASGVYLRIHIYSRSTECDIQASRYRAWGGFYMSARVYNMRARAEGTFWPAFSITRGQRIYIAGPFLPHSSDLNNASDTTSFPSLLPPRKTFIKHFSLTSALAPGFPSYTYLSLSLYMRSRTVYMTLLYLIPTRPCCSLGFVFARIQACASK